MLIETIQKRINEIKQQDRKSYYEIANEIGISESTLYQLMSKGELFTPAEQKIIAYLKGYLTKDEKLEAYRLDNEELKAENDRLKAEIKEVKKYQYQQEYLDKEIAELKAYKDVNEDFKTAWDELKAENDRLKKELDIALREENRWKSNFNNYRDVCRKQYQTLQKIKAIVKNICNGCTSECDCDEDCNYFLITEKLTKTEEE